MKQGALIFDKESGRYNIRFGLNDYYGGLHCGECFDVFAGGKWKPTRIEMSACATKRPGNAHKTPYTPALTICITSLPVSHVPAALPAARYCLHSA